MSPFGEVATVPAAVTERGSQEMSESDTEESEDGLPWAVRPGEAAALVEAYRRAQAAEACIRRLLEAKGIPAETARPVATLDSRGRPAVRLTLRRRSEPAPRGDSRGPAPQFIQRLGLPTMPIGGRDKCASSCGAPFAGDRSNCSATNQSYSSVDDINAARGSPSSV